MRIHYEESVIIEGKKSSLLQVHLAHVLLHHPLRSPSGVRVRLRPSPFATISTHARQQR